MKICIAGKNKISVDVLYLLLEKGINKENIIAINNSTDDGIHSWQPSFKAVCEVENIRTRNIEDVYKLDDLVFLSTEFDQIIKPDSFKSQHLINIHFSLLPAYKGMYTSVMPILKGEINSGVTLHIIDRGIDTGDIIDQIKFAIPFDFNSFDLYCLFLSTGLNLFRKNIDGILGLNYIARPQPSMGASYYSKKQIDFTNLTIDFHKTAFEIYNYVRAFSFRPYQLLQLNGTLISHARISEIRSNSKTGKLIDENQFCLRYSTIDYDVILYKDFLHRSLEAAKIGQLSFIKQLDELGYKLYEKDNNGRDVLMLASHYEQYEVCSYLLNRGLSPNTWDKNGASVLVYAMNAASRSNKTNIIELLLDYGSDLRHKDYLGNSVVDYARKCGNPIIMRFIEQRL